MDTKEMIERKGFDPKAIEFLNNFLYEFNDLFGSYLSQEEVLERINDYLDEIEFVEEIPYSEENGVIGLYNLEEKKVYIRKSDIESEKSTFFHEMVHVLHEKLVTAELQENFEIQDESHQMYLTGIGVDEGFTEYLTSKRNEKFSKEKIFNSYPILTQQFRFLANIVGEEDLISGIFNGYEQVSGLLQKKLNWEENDCSDYCKAMSVIAKYEKEVLREKIEASRKKSAADRAFDIIFGDQNQKKSRFPREVDSAIDEIVKKYLMQTVNSVEDFYSLMENMKMYAKSLGKDVGAEMMLTLYQQYKKHPEFNLEESNPELCEPFKIYDKLQEFYDLCFEEKLQFVAEDRELQTLIFNANNSYDFKKMIIQHMCVDDKFGNLGLDRFVRDDHQLSDYNALYGMLTSGLLKEKIQSGEVKPEALALEWIQYDDYDGEFSLFNIFNANGTKEEYLGTYALGELDCNEVSQYEIAKMTVEEKRKMVSRICQDVYDSKMTDESVEKYLFLCDSKSKEVCYACSEENQWMIFEWDDSVMEIYDKPEYISSIAEENIKRTKRWLDMGQDDILCLLGLQHAGVIEQSVVKEYIGKKIEKQYLTPDDIEVEINRQNVTIGEIKKKVQEVAERVDKKKQGDTLLINGGEDIEK